MKASPKIQSAVACRVRLTLELRPLAFCSSVGCQAQYMASYKRSKQPPRATASRDFGNKLQCQGQRKSMPVVPASQDRVCSWASTERAEHGHQVQAALAALRR